MTASPALFSVGTGLQNLGLALLIGGLLALGAFTAPVLFKSFARHEAGEAMTIIFRRYDIVCLVALGIIFVGEGLRISYSGFSGLGIFSSIRYLFLLGLLATTLYGTLVINPKIAAFQAEGLDHVALEEKVEFRKVHTLSEKLAKAELFLALVLMLMTPFATALPVIKSGE